MAIPSPPSSRSSSPALSSDEERQEVKRRKVQFEAAASSMAKAGGEASTSVFAPPKGMKKAAGDEVLTEFNAEAIKEKLSKGCELWAIRLPQNLNKLRYLNDVKISLPDHADDSITETSEKIGELHVKKNDYSIYSLSNNTEDVSTVGAGEMRNMTALLANKRKKYIPVPIQRHLVVKQDISFPPDAVIDDIDAADWPVKHQQPEGLNGFFAPLGYSTTLTNSTSKRAPTELQDDEIALLRPLSTGVITVEDVPMAQSSPSKEDKKKLKKEKKEKKEEKKKRKSEVAAV